MQRTRLVAFIAAISMAGVAQAQSTVVVRGTITAIGPHVLAVKSRDGRDLEVRLPENVTVAVAKAIKFEEIKQGDYVGATTTPGAEGARVAVEVHYIAASVPPGFIASWDLQPGSGMTNARVDNVVLATGRRELILKYKDAAQRVLVPEGIPLVRAVPGSRTDLVPGEYIFAVALVGADGSLTAPRIQVSKDGVRPPQ